jgi:cellulose synthase/poly-beta-1,6-N-acetylglucosamine synthase-like glycosyltransferase
MQILKAIESNNDVLGASGIIANFKAKVSEDAELSIRLRIAGWNSRHWEEAPLKFKPWLKQRTRWYRG